MDKLLKQRALVRLANTSVLKKDVEAFRTKYPTWENDLAKVELITCFHEFWNYESGNSFQEFVLYDVEVFDYVKVDKTKLFILTRKEHYAALF